MGRARQRESRLGLPWRIVEHHYWSRNLFQEIYDSYETRVGDFVATKGRAREKLKLSLEETRALFDSDMLRRLIQQGGHPLREVAHAYFRERDVAEPYDSTVSRIYHELSILKEEHLSVWDFPRDGKTKEFARLFQEVSEYYPQRLGRAKDLFARAQKRFDKILPEFAADTIVLRSSYLFREELWPTNPRPALTRFLGKMFPDGGAVHGYRTVARSFFRAGFYRHAAECARMGAASGGKEAQARTTRAQQIRDIISDLDSLAARAEAEARALTEQAK